MQVSCRINVRFLSGQIRLLSPKLSKRVFNVSHSSFGVLHFNVDVDRWIYIQNNLTFVFESFTATGVFSGTGLAQLPILCNTRKLPASERHSL